MKKNIKYWLKAGCRLADRLKSSESSLKKQSQLPSTPKKSTKTERTGGEKSPNATKDYVLYVSDIIDRIVRNLDNLLQVSSLIPSNHVLEIYISDNLLYEYCLNQGFVNLLKERMYMDRSYSFDDCRLLPKLPEQNVHVTDIMPDVFIRLQTKNVPQESVSAKINVMDNFGSLLEDPVLLDGNHLPAGKANIGVGRHAQMDDGSVRVNIIAVDDNTESPQYERNKYVSRAHANIQFRNGHFMLFVETGGTSRTGKRTAVSRNGKLIKLDVAGMGINLEDNDQIILSKNVILIFKNND